MSALAIAWPQTPLFELRAQRRRWPFAVAVVIVAVAAAFAVPQSRAAILDLFDFGGVTIERVGTLPAAQERPLGANLGQVISEAEAKDALGRRPLLPDVPVTLHLRGNVVSMLFTYRGQTLLLSEFRGGFPGILKKVIGPSAGVEQASQGLWIEGAHLYVFPQAPPRLAGNVLLWLHAGLTLRLEGKALTRDQALTLSIRIR